MISGIVLAAGTSSRLGRPKQLLDLGGRPLLQHVIDAAADELDEIVIVLGHLSDEIAEALSLPPHARIELNPGYRGGQSTSLRMGLDSIDPRSEAAVILLGDQPGLTASMIRRVLTAFSSSRSPITRAVWQGTPGHPVVVARSRWDSFREAEGDAGARAIIAAASDVEEVEMGAPAPVDIDTWEDYTEARGVYP